ncbi:hypothetical protein MD588_13740 [Photobacterium sp. SDRW27]|uniref:hypothetical protein n=1 Tax=Photobacterium obscurum TaxID=2829490 RepID=UPI00224362B0|nr:hypothetical protein [Photobacterium obscurum]MCW8329869.1 hypothetical protein [Photobacterium obscurum]
MRLVLVITALLYSFASLADDRQLGEVFIDQASSEQPLEFIGGGNRPVDNAMIDKNSVYQDKNRVDPTEFGAGLKFNATDDFSISVEAGGEVIDNQAIEVDSGSVVFELSY